MAGNNTNIQGLPRVEATLIEFINKSCFSAFPNVIYLDQLTLESIS